MAVQDIEDQSWDPVYSPDGMKILFNAAPVSDPNPHLYVMNSNGTGLALLSECMDGCPIPDWRPQPRRAHSNESILIRGHE